MSLESLGAIANILSALGVIATLLYLARQIHQANRATVASMSNAVSHFFADHLITLGGNRQLCEVLAREAGGTPLDDVDRLQAMFVLRAQMAAFENYFNQHRLGFMDAPGWHSRRAIAIAILRTPSVRAMWDTRLAREQHPDFATEINAHLPALPTSAEAS